MSVGYYQSLRAKRAEDVEEIQRCAKELNKEYNLLVMEDGQEPGAGIFGLDYIAEGISFSVPASASDEISKFEELVQRIVKSHPDMPVEYHEGTDSMGHIYYSRNGELIEYTLGTICLYVESDVNYEALKDAASREIKAAGFNSHAADDSRKTISWEYIMDDEDSTKKTYNVISAISSYLNQTPIACYVYNSLSMDMTPEYHCIALDGQFEWKETNDAIRTLHDSLWYYQDEIPISIVQLYTDPMKTFELFLDFVRSRYMDRDHIRTVECILYDDKSRQYISKLKSDDKKWLLTYLKLDSMRWSTEKQEAISAYCDTHDEKLLEIIYGD